MVQEAQVAQDLMVVMELLLVVLEVVEHLEWQMKVKWKFWMAELE